MDRGPDTSIREERSGGLSEDLGQKRKATSGDVIVTEQVAEAVGFTGQLGVHGNHAYSDEDGPVLNRIRYQPANQLGLGVRDLA